jgi:hypothetical protein
MRCCITLLLCSAFMSCVAGRTFGETYTAQFKKYDRKLQVARHYEVPAEAGKPVRAIIPAMMSFWGATNWQVVKTSTFQYSEEPDDVKITTDNQGELRRNYQLTWKSPKSDKITIQQTMDVELTFSNKLSTTATLPYSDDILKRFSASLVTDEKQGINADNKDLDPICKQILRRARTAEAAVEGVCDWVNENIKFVKGKRTSDEAFAQKQGSCTPMSLLACAMLRHMAVPAEVVTAKFIGGDGGHAFIEVYFPDAGWVFYDLSNWNRGFKSLDCLVCPGFAYRIVKPGNTQWVNGYFCQEKDEMPYPEDDLVKSSKLIRKPPTGSKVLSASVFPRKTPASIKVRQRPIRELLLDTEIPPGPRPYSDDAPKESKEKEE